MGEEADTYSFPSSAKSGSWNFESGREAIVLAQWDIEGSMEEWVGESD